MQLFTSWTKPNEIIASDMPWAVAWYSDRKSLWLPAKLETLTEFYNLHTLGGPIAGIYLTPVSRDLGYASQIFPDKQWRIQGMATALPAQSKSTARFSAQAYHWGRK